MSIPEDICDFAARKLEGSNLTFALVLWVKGEQANPDSVALCAPPESQPESVAALRTTADAAEARGGR